LRSFFSAGAEVLAGALPPVEGFFSATAFGGMFDIESWGRLKRERERVERSVTRDERVETEKKVAASGRGRCLYTATKDARGGACKKNTSKKFKESRQFDEIRFANLGHLP